MTNEQTIDAIMDAVLASQTCAFLRGDGNEGYEESVSADQSVRDMIASALAAKDAEIAELKQRLADSMRDLQALKASHEPGEWVEWKGGECPIAKTSACVVKFGDGDICDTEMAGYWCWTHCDNQSNNIIAYRIIT